MSETARTPKTVRELTAEEMEQAVGGLTNAAVFPPRPRVPGTVLRPELPEAAGRKTEKHP